MEYLKNKVKDIKIAYIGGGSKGWAWTFMSDLALEEKLSGTIKLFDIDHEAAQKNEIIGNRLLKRDDVKGKWKYKAVDSLKKALESVDFVIISILPGTLDEMESDVHTPEKYGIYQSTGDTVGAAGIIRALRAIPMFVEFAEAIKKYAPEAWVINYTNPLTLCTRILYKIFPRIKAFGCCHEVLQIQNYLGTKVLRNAGKIEVNSIEEVTVNVLGINHFTWFDKASYRGLDLFPLFKQYVADNYKNGNKNVRMDLFRRYGLMAAAGDRHLAEFVPNSWYLQAEDPKKEWGSQMISVSERKEREEKLKEKSKNLVNGKEFFELKKSSEEGVKLIKALLGFNNVISNVNLPNYGQMQGIPKRAIVETNASFSRDNVQPVNAGRLPLPLENLVLTHVLNQETIIKAALNKDKNLAFTAFINDPMLVSLNLNDARDLFNEMLENTKKYLSGWKI